MTPYRSRREEKAAAAPETGLVADMVRQFADPYAFLRELVQNGIDAGASRLDVRIEREPGGRVATTVADDGGGMTQETLEGPLLTLFSSTKEDKLDAIGRYGVGFISVFAIDPAAVEVETWCSGNTLILRLFRDHRYEIEEGPPRPASGTRVTLVTAMDREAFVRHAERAEASLRRWCRHAELPIALRVVDLDAGEASEEIRIDVPLGVWGPIAVVETIARAGVGKEVFVVGAASGSGHLPASMAPRPEAALERAPTFAGFYNRGLTLFETTEPLAPSLVGLRFKVVSPCLQHTLSRDNIRRDADLDRVLATVRAIAASSLREALTEALSRAAQAAASGDPEPTYAALLDAAIFKPFALPAEEITFPLASPVRGARALRDLRRASPGPEILIAAGSSAITEALAWEGQPVVLALNATTEAALRRCYPGAAIEEARARHLLVSELPDDALDDADRALLRALHRVMQVAGEDLGRVAYGAIDGALGERAAVVIPEGRPGAPHLAAVREIGPWWNRWSSKHRLMLNVAAEPVRLARAEARRSPGFAAHLLGRALLVEGRGPLSPRVNDRLLSLAAEALG